MGAVFGGIVAIGGAAVIKCLCLLCWLGCSYWWGCCNQMVRGAVLVGV